jgi:DNA (cytosine-5)-methyltransferase 1
MTRYRPLLIDLYCCAGGAAAGYHRAGFDVLGVDSDPQPDYPFPCVRADAIEYLSAGLPRRAMAVHASPPCQAYTPLNAYNHHDYPDLVAPTRDLLALNGLPYVIENVPQAPLCEPVTLCGPMFGLRVYRHRAFEPGGGLTIEPPPHPPHIARCARNGYLPTADRPFMSIHGGRHSRAWQRAAAEVLGTPWMTTIRQVCEAIPPAYTRYIGAALLAVAGDQERAA